ncbi:MAG: bifunctional precorrin-2 dehydrogenase/sirohydrochlorin ferrochelatase [Armatimonadetes bacterium]|nr:bifunctional precorrin-2 dehydrogenase/sirohydrochlorin ferrochelatase [Armatimonadota bacterium]
MLDLRGRRCVVVGGGGEAERKVAQLLEVGAEVVVVAGEVTERLRGWAQEGRIRWEARGYRWGDLAGAWLAISAPEDRGVNREVREEAEALGVWLNAVDDPARCSFLVPAVYRQGDLVVAVSTSGKAPALAVRIRDEVAGRLGPEYAAFLELAGEVRAELVRRVPEFERRRGVWYRIVDSEVLEHLRRGAVGLARARMWELVEEGG